MCVCGVCTSVFTPLVYVCLCLEQEDEEASTGSHLKLIVDAFIQQLPNCVNRDLIDKASTHRNKLGQEHALFFKSLICVCDYRMFILLFSFNQAAMDFCMNMNTKSNRRKLVRALFTVPRQRCIHKPYKPHILTHLCMKKQLIIVLYTDVCLDNVQQVVLLIHF